MYLILMSLAVWDFLSTPCCCGCQNPNLGRAPHSELAALPSREGWGQSLQLSPHNCSLIISNHMEDSVCKQRVQSHKDQCWKERPSSFLSYRDALSYRTFCLLAPCPPGTLRRGGNHAVPAKFSQEPLENLYCALVFYTVGQHTEVHIGHHVIKNRCDFFYRNVCGPLGNLSHKHLNEKYHGGNSLQTSSVTLEV